MIPPLSSVEVHMIVEYIKSVGFWLETDETEQLGARKILQRDYGIRATLNSAELAMVAREMRRMAEENELREAKRKMWELEPEDRGVVRFRQPSGDQFIQASSYPVFYSYPVDENLRQVRAHRGLRFRSQKRSPGLAGV